MKRKIFQPLIWLWIGILLLGACSRKTLPVGALRVSTWHGALKVDGMLDEPAWKKAGQATLRRSDGGADASQSTVVMCSHDSENLILGFICKDADIFSPYLKRDDPLYLKEAVEIFLDMDGDQKDYMEFEVSPAGVMFDASFTARRQGMNLGFNPECRVAAHVDGTLNNRNDTDRQWSVELVIPFSQMTGRGKRPPKHGDCWRANFYRLDAIEALSWRPTSGDFHDLKAFGQICF